MLPTFAYKMLKMKFLLERRVSLIALLSTLAVFVILFIWSPQDSSLLLRDYSVNIDIVKFLYFSLILILCGVFCFEPQIRLEFTQGKSLVIFLAGTVSFACVWLNVPTQVSRLAKS